MTDDQIRVARTLIVSIIGLEVRLVEDIEELEDFCCDGSELTGIPSLSAIISDAVTSAREADVERDGPEVEAVLAHILEELGDVI
ncbi:hypothetical protein LCGC14_1330270 [marine sediment metagenome]|uniref:Uncharacterized protein n=1 Tax=marine sediment metagenome TaxID=412755 RepID=A0A0F9L2S1_9ZZZZ